MARSPIRRRPTLRQTYRGEIHHRPADRLDMPMVPPSPLTHDKDPDLASLTDDERIYKQAEERFHICEQWEKDTRRLYLEDLKFANADPDNGFQWPNHIRRNRDVDRRPALTVNKTRQHCLQIINDCKQNKPSVSVKPTGDGASFASAQVFENMCRHIESDSHAQAAYDRATEFQVKTGIGYVRLVTEYESDDSFNQVIKIVPVKEPLGIYLDPDINQQDGSDARFGFVFEDMPKDKFKREYPEYKDRATIQTLTKGDNWLDMHHVRVAEYFCREEKRDTLISFMEDDPSSQGQKKETVERLSRLREVIPPDNLKEIRARSDTKEREISTQNIMWYKIVGREIVEKKEWLGKYIPIVRMIGEETVIDGHLDRKGHVRNLKDPQRIYNYWTSAAVEHLALQGKTPWVASAEAIEGYETFWFTANVTNHAVLPYNALDEDANKIEMPQRAPSPEMAKGYIEGMQISAQEFMMASGQYESKMGEQGNERSGKAIQERERRADNSTFHFVDNQAITVRHVGVILVDLVPKIYDTKRVTMMTGKDKKQHQVTIDPQQTQAHMEIMNQRDQEVIETIFNPCVGKYMVLADMGPSYSTQRQEAFNAYVQIITQRPEAFGIIGDLLLAAADFPTADVAAERIKRSIPAYILGEGPTAAEQQLTQENTQYKAMIADMTQKLATEQLKKSSKELDKEIDMYDAITRRINVLIDRIPTPADIAGMVRDVIVAEHKHNLDLQANQLNGGGGAGQVPPASEKPDAGTEKGLLEATAGSDALLNPPPAPPVPAQTPTPGSPQAGGGQPALPMPQAPPQQRPQAPPQQRPQ